MSYTGFMLVDQTTGVVSNFSFADFSDITSQGGGSLQFGLTHLSFGNSLVGYTGGSFNGSTSAQDGLGNNDAFYQGTAVLNQNLSLFRLSGTGSVCGNTYCSPLNSTGFMLVDQTTGVVSNFSFAGFSDITGQGGGSLQFGPLTNFSFGNSLIGYTGGSFTGSTSSDYEPGDDIAFYQGTAVDDNPAILAAMAPEPSSLILLGTGALGMIGVIRQRIAQC